MKMKKNKKSMIAMSVVSVFLMISAVTASAAFIEKEGYEALSKRSPRSSGFLIDLLNTTIDFLNNTSERIQNASTIIVEFINTFVDPILQVIDAIILALESVRDALI